MRKFTRMIVLIVAAIAILYIAIAISLNTFLKPNKLKAKVTNLIQQKTGRTLSISEDMHWSVFPQIALKLNNIKLSNTAAFGNTTFIKAQQVKLNMQLMPLLKGDIKIASINIDGVTIYLIKNSQGQTNWTNTTNNIGQISKTDATQNHNSTTTAEKNLTLTIANLNVTNGTVIWNDQQTKQAATLTNLNLHSQKIAFGRSFPLQLSFTLSNTAQGTPMHFNLNTQLMADPEKNTYILSNLTSALGQTHMKGKVSYNAAKISQLNFAMDIDELNLDTFANLFSSNAQPATNKKDAANAKATTKADQASPFAVLNTLNITGKINIDKLTIKHLNLQNLHVNINNARGMLKLAPITANLYQGNLTTNVTVDARTSIPQYTVNSDLSGIQIGALLNDLTGKSSLSGTTTVTASVTTQGKQNSTLMRNLNGNLKLAITNGAINGMDIFGLIRQATAFINTGHGDITLSSTTQFSSLTGSAVITNGVLQNHDLLLTSNHLSANGAGAINFINNHIYYRIVATGEVDQKNKVEIPVTIDGNLDNPHASVDFGSLAKKAVAQELGKQIEKQTGIPVQNILKKFNLDL